MSLRHFSVSSLLAGWRKRKFREQYNTCPDALKNKERLNGYALRGRLCGKSPSPINSDSESPTKKVQILPEPIKSKKASLEQLKGISVILQS